MAKKEWRLWSYYTDFKDWKPRLRAYYPYASEGELRVLMDETNIQDLKGIRYELKNVNADCDIISIADMEFCDGRYLTYSKFWSPSIAECLFSSADYNTYYVDARHDLRCRGVHQEGTNHILYRSFKKELSNKQINNFCWKIRNGMVTRRDIRRYTNPIGDYVLNYYGVKL